MGMPRRSGWLVFLMLALVAPSAASAAGPAGDATAQPLVTGLKGGAGSTIGPDGALDVTETAAGRITRVDPKTGATTTYASGLPKSIIGGEGGAMDIAFLGRAAYVLVSLVGPDVGGSDVVGIYRIDGPNSFTVVADIGEFAINNPPATPFEVPSGLQYALETYRHGFLVSDGHHNRVLRVARNGEVTELIAFVDVECHRCRGVSELCCTTLTDAPWVRHTCASLLIRLRAPIRRRPRRPPRWSRNRCGRPLKTMWSNRGHLPFACVWLRQRQCPTCRLTWTFLPCP